MEDRERKRARDRERNGEREREGEKRGLTKEGGRQNKGKRVKRLFCSSCSLITMETTDHSLELQIRAERWKKIKTNKLKKRQIRTIKANPKMHLLEQDRLTDSF